MIPSLESNQNICQLIPAGGSSNTASRDNDSGNKINGADTKFGDCGDPSGMLGPLLEVADEMMGAFDGFDSLVEAGLEKASEIGNKIKDDIGEVGPVVLQIGV